MRITASFRIRLLHGMFEPIDNNFVHTDQGAPPPRSRWHIACSGAAREGSRSDSSFSSQLVTDVGLRSDISGMISVKVVRSAYVQGLKTGGEFNS